MDEKIKCWGLLLDDKELQLHTIGISFSENKEGPILFNKKVDAEHEIKFHRADPKRFKIIPVILTYKKGD